jgi:hypothetical protein
MSKSAAVVTALVVTTMLASMGVVGVSAAGNESTDACD